MSELTDLEICKCIAEIEGYHTNLTIKCEGVWCSMNDNNCYGVFNPLLDDALCFQLMVKYNLSLIAPEREQEDWDCVIRDVLTVHKNPNKAICLAIIEVYKVKS